MRERSLSEETGMGALLRPKGVGTYLRALLAPQLLHLEVVHGARLLHLVQGLDIRCAAGPRGVAVRAAARRRSPAHHVRGRIQPALDRPGRAHQRRASRSNCQATCRRADCPCRRQGSFTEQCQSSSTRFRRCCRFRPCCRSLRRRGKAFGGFCFCQLLRCKSFDVLSGVALHLRSSLAGSLEQGLHFGRPADYLIICGGGTSSGGGASPGGLLGIRSVRSSQSPPPLRMLKVWFSATLRVAAAAPAAPPAMIVSAA